MKIAMIIGISAAAAALCFIVITVYAVLALRTARASIKQAGRTMAKAEEEMDRISARSLTLMEEAGEMTEQTKDLIKEMQLKVQAADRLIGAVRQAGDTVGQVTASVHQVSSAVAESVNQTVLPKLRSNQEKIGDLAEWAGLTWQLWLKWRSQRQASNSSKTGDERND